MWMADLSMAIGVFDRVSKVHQLPAHVVASRHGSFATAAVKIWGGQPLWIFMAVYWLLEDPKAQVVDSNFDSIEK